MQRGQGDTGSGADAAFDRVDRADLGEPFGGQQYVIVLADRAGDHRSTPALGGDGLAAFLADLQDLGDFLGGSGPDQDARSPEIAPGVIDGSSGQDIGVRADVSLADDLDQGASERRHGPQCGIHIALRGFYRRLEFIQMNELWSSGMSSAKGVLMESVPALSLAERDRRWGLARELMRRTGVDALIVYGDREAGAPAAFNVDGYFTNDRLGSIVLFVRDEAPTVLTFASMMIADHLQARYRGDTQWIEPDQIFVGKTGSHLAAALKHRGVSSGPVGVLGLGHTRRSISTGQSHSGPCTR